jgi:cytochrome o ubiquinol oxidase subunit 1
VFAFGFGFGLTWRIWWMAGLCLLGMIAVVIYRSFARDEGYVLSAETMARLEHERPLGVVSESQYLTHAAPPHVAPALEAV